MFMYRVCKKGTYKINGGINQYRPGKRKRLTNRLVSDRDIESHNIISLLQRLTDQTSHNLSEPVRGFNTRAHPIS